MDKPLDVTTETHYDVGYIPASFAINDISIVYRNKIIKSLSKLMNIDKNIINLKGKTVEKLGLIGKESAIACESIVSIYRYE